MSATATPTPSAPAPAWLAAPAGDWKTLSAAMTAEVPAIAGCPVPVACAPGRAWATRPATCATSRSSKLTATCWNPPRTTATPPSPVTGSATRSPGAPWSTSAPTPRTRLPPAARRGANWCQAARQLEESRIEARQACRRPADRRYLRASATKLVFADFTAAGADPAEPSRGRYRRCPPAGPRGRRNPRTGRDDPGHCQGRGRHRPHQPRPAPGNLARVPRRRRRRPAHQDRPRPPLVPHPGHRPRRRPARPHGHQIPSELAKALARAIEILAERSPPTSPRRRPLPPDAADKREHEKASRRNAEKAAREVFGRRTRPRAITGTRDPHEDETAAARRLTRALARPPPASAPPSPSPPRSRPAACRMGKALAGQAQRAAGAVPTAEPFTHTRSRRVPAPPLRVGIACDISGSMGAFAGPVASAAWILARAAGHLPSALTASVLFGKGVYALTRPGERPAKVTGFTATASTESASARSTPSTARWASPAAAPPACWSSSPTPFRSPRRARRGPAAHHPPAPRRLRRHHPHPRRRSGICKYTDCQVTEAASPAGAIDAIARAATHALTA